MRNAPLVISPYFCAPSGESDSSDDGVIRAAERFWSPWSKRKRYRKSSIKPRGAYLLFVVLFAFCGLRVGPHFRYCCSVWGSCGATTRKALDKLQNRAIRIITNSAYDVSVGPLLKQLQLPSISDMIKQESASMVYKALNAEAPIYLAEQFSRVSYITSRTLRSSNLSLRPPRLKSRNGQNCFAYRGSSIWNSLSSEIKSSMTFGSFQTKLKAMLAETN